VNISITTSFEKRDVIKSSKQIDIKFAIFHKLFWIF